MPIIDLFDTFQGTRLFKNNNNNKTHLPMIRDSPVSAHSLELSASKIEFSNNFIAFYQDTKKKQHFVYIVVKPKK